MKRIGMLFTAAVFVFTAAVLPASAQTDEVFSMDIVLSDNQQEWTTENVILVTDDEQMTYEYASTPEAGLVISFRLVGESLRVGAREPTCSGLQVRKDIPLADIKNNRLHVSLTYREGKYMLYADQTAINDRNWNTECPEGVSEDAWKTTDNIALCTDYSRLKSGGMEDEDGELAFLMQDISSRPLYIQADEYAAFTLQNIQYGYTPAESQPENSRTSAEGSETEAPDSSSGQPAGSSAVWYIAGGAVLAAAAIVALVLILRKKRASTGEENK